MAWLTMGVKNMSQEEGQPADNEGSWSQRKREAIEELAQHFPCNKETIYKSSLFILGSILEVPRASHSHLLVLASTHWLVFAFIGIAYLIFTTAPQTGTVRHTCVSAVAALLTAFIRFRPLLLN